MHCLHSTGDAGSSRQTGRAAALALLRLMLPPPPPPRLARRWSFLWAEGGKQPGLEASLGVGGYGYPALVALKPSDLKYSTMRR